MRFISKRSKKAIVLIAFAVFAICAVATGVIFTDFGVDQATYSKALLSWNAPPEGSGVAGYKVFRDNVQIADIADNAFTDTGLTPGQSYSYRVTAYDSEGLDLETSIAVTAETLNVPTVADASYTQQVVDYVNISNVETATDLVSAVRSAFTTLFGVTDTSFGVLDETLVTQMVAREQAFLAETDTPMTADEAAQARAEIDSMRNEHFGGHSLSDVYLHEKLVELGDAHWNAGKPAAAKLLYEKALETMSDHELFVFNDLWRLSYFENAVAGTDSSRADTIDAVNAAADRVAAFFDYFPNSVSLQAENALARGAYLYFNRFPKLLAYDQYDVGVYNNAEAFIAAARDINNNAREQWRFNRMTAWKLGAVSLRFETDTGAPLSGDAYIQNTAGDWLYPDSAPHEIRHFLITTDSGVAEMPVYRGHPYTLSVNVNPWQGTPINYAFSSLDLSYGVRFTYRDDGQGPTVTNLGDNTRPPEYVFSIGRLDSDGDGLSDYDETNLYNTNPNAADSDGDGLSDAFEVLCAGTDPNVAGYDASADPDSDGMDNLTEQALGFDPAIPATQTDGYAYELTVLEDAENLDTAGWEVIPANSAARVANEADPDSAANRCIALNANGAVAEYAFTIPAVRQQYPKLRWSGRFSGACRVTVGCYTNMGRRYLVYDVAAFTSSDATVIPYRLRASTASGKWRTITRDLQRDLAAAVPGCRLLTIDRFQVKGAGKVDNIAFVNYPDADNDMVPDTLEVSLGMDSGVSDYNGDFDADSVANGDEFVYGTNFRGPDSDGDGLTDGMELDWGLDPLDPSDAAAELWPAADVSSLSLAAGAIASYYKASWTKLPDFTAWPAYGSGVVSAVNFERTAGNFAASGRANAVGAVFRGYLDIPANGYYKFYLTSNDGSRLYIDGTKVIESDGVNLDLEKSVALPLAVGKHAFKIEYFEYSGDALLSLAWERPAFFARQAVPAAAYFYDTAAYLAIKATDDADADGVPDDVEAANGSSSSSSDTDGDGLSDYDEIYLYHTNAAVKDSDGDGVNDFDEITQAFTDPNAADSFGSVTDAQVLNGVDASAASDGWLVSGTALYAECRNGWLTYNVTAPAAGFYRLEVTGTQNNSLTTIKTFTLDLYLNNEFGGTQTLTAAYGADGKACFYLPKLEAGTYSAKIVWRNILDRTFLKVRQVKLQSLGGADGDNDGVPDWIEARLAALSGVAAPSVSKTSPVCVEGENAAYIEQIRISGFYVAEGEEPDTPVARRAIGDNWYANVPLAPNAPTALTASFQSGVPSQNLTVTWAATNVLSDADSNAVIRKNDALLFTACPENAGPGTFVLHVDGETLNGTTSAPAPVKFSTAGTYTVDATYTPDSAGSAVSGQMTVKVVACDLAGNPACVVGTPRQWLNPDVPTEAALEHDNPLTLLETPLSPKGRKITLFAPTVKTCRVVARLGSNGPIMDVAEAFPLEYKFQNETYGYTVLQVFPDGSKLISGRIVLGRVEDDFVLKIRIGMSGVVFEDGTIIKTITPADLDENGVYKYRMIMGPNVPHAPCHTILLYQNNELIAQG